MGIEGIDIYKTNPKVEILASIKKHKGIISAIAHHLDCSCQTIYNLMARDPDIKNAMETARSNLIESRLDLAESVVAKIMGRHEEKPGVALSASMYLLNNLGNVRGYAHPDKKTDKIGETIESIDGNIKVAAKRIDNASNDEHDEE